MRDPHPDPRIAELMHRLAEATANSRSAQASLTELRIERAKLVNDLRASGVTDRRIAAHLGIHPSALQRLAGSKRSQSQKAETA